MLHRGHKRSFERAAWSLTAELSLDSGKIDLLQNSGKIDLLQTR
jgi:hypothetical protein